MTVHRPVRWLLAITLLGALFSASLGIASAADGSEADPLAQYIGLIDEVRAELNRTVELYQSGDERQALASARKAYLDSFELVEFPLRERDPNLTLEMEDAFAELRANIRARVPAEEVVRNVARLQLGMQEVERTLTLEGYAPLIVAGTAFVIVARAGLEAILIIAAILGYLAAARATRMRRTVMWGVLAAGVATVATWFVIRWVILNAPVRPAVVEAIPALIAVIILVGFSIWLLSRLDRRRWLEFMSARVFSAVATGSVAALFLLGFTAVYRPGFEAVVFFQSLLNYSRGLEGGLLAGSALGVLAIIGIGWIVFRLGRRLPITTFYAVSLVVVMLISVAFIGNAVRSLQEGYVIGITNLTGQLPRLPIYLSQATGYHPTLETIVAQLGLLAVYALAGLWVFLTTRRRRRPDPAGPNLIAEAA